MKKAREYGSLIDKITAIHSDLLLYLRKKWGNSSELTLEDYIRMEEYERHTLSHYPFKDEARKDVIRKLAKLSVLSDKYISEGNTIAACCAWLVMLLPARTTRASIRKTLLTTAIVFLHAVIMAIEFAVSNDALL